MALAPVSMCLKKCTATCLLEKEVENKLMYLNTCRCQGNVAVQGKSTITQILRR